MGPVDLEFPLYLEINISTSRLQLAGEAPSEGFDHCSSDELATRMLAIVDSWEFAALDYDAMSAMLMRVNGRSANEELRAACKKPAPKQRAAKTQVSEAFAALDELGDDPLAPAPRMSRCNKGGKGRGAPRGSNRGGSRAPRDLLAAPNAHHRAAIAPIEDCASSDRASGSELSQSDAEVMLGNGPPLASAFVDTGLCELAQGTIEELGALHRDVEEGGGDGGGAAVSSAGDGGEAFVVEGASLAGEVAEQVWMAAGWADDAASSAAPAPAPEPAPMPLPALPEEAVAVVGGPPGWTITPQGHVFSPLHRKVGRLTKWGTSQSMKCNYHSGCSLAKGQKAATPGQLLTWLALAAGEEHAPPKVAKLAAAVAAGADHKAQWHALLSESAASSSSGAA